MSISAIAGETKALSSTYRNSAGTATDPTSPTLRIYNEDRKLLLVFALTSSEKTGTGAYTYNYAIPRSVIPAGKTQTTLAYEFSGTVSGIAGALDRDEIVVTWV